MSLEEVEAKYRACSLCSVADYRLDEVSLQFVGNPKATYMVIGEAPVLDEEEGGGLLSGVYGKMLRAAFRAASLSFDEVFYTTLIGCRSTNSPGGKDFDISGTQVRNCNSRVYAMLLEVKPRAVICIGNKVYREFSKVISPSFFTLSFGKVCVLQVSNLSDMLRIEGTENQVSALKKLSSEIAVARELIRREAW